MLAEEQRLRDTNALANCVGLDCTYSRLGHAEVISHGAFSAALSLRRCSPMISTRARTNAGGTPCIYESDGRVFTRTAGAAFVRPLSFLALVLVCPYIPLQGRRQRCQGICFLFPLQRPDVRVPRGKLLIADCA